METFLDLAVHSPDEYEGKRVDIFGVEYEIGHRLGIGGEKVVHTLRNVRSGWTGLVIKIWGDISFREAAGARRSALLRRMLLLSNSDVSVRLVSTLEVEAANGAFQVQPSLVDHEPADVMLSLSAALDRQRAGDGAGEIEEYRKILAHRPLHPTALHNCSVALWHAGERAQAIDMMHVAMTTEPCDGEHLLNLAAYQRAIGQSTVARMLISIYVDRFPFELDRDAFVVEAYLDAGVPELAEAFLAKRFHGLGWPPPPHDLTDEVTSSAPLRKYQALHASILAVVERNARASGMVDVARELIIEEPQSAAKLLASALEVAPWDNDIRTNLAIASFRSGDVNSAFEHFFRAGRAATPPRSSACLANAAFCLFKQRAIAAGIKLLDMALSEGCGADGAIGANDVPGLLAWVHGNTACEERLASAIGLLEHAAVGCSAEEMRRLTALIALYREACGKVLYEPPPGPA
ncbi:tetratricopeptide repeat protein [Sorangium sp. So ce542]|uniref:tetratricopeptide repeat protein n=1 Tax=Sorangium sp. So ce542 TaxID=3133316 RepID=UPI003F616AF0